MTEYTTVVLFIKALVAPVGIGLTILAYRAYRESGDASLRLFTLGFGAITVGSIFGGGIDTLFGVGINIGLLVQSLFLAIGFLVLARSVSIRENTPGEGDTKLVTINK
jgi:predicted lysophospholipase L1 biosynthesis ABC-type transport system permease subunit